jgi:hypothetical protein
VHCTTISYTKEEEEEEEEEEETTPRDGIISAKGGEFLSKSDLETRPLLKKDSAPWWWLITY